LGDQSGTDCSFSNGPFICCHGRCLIVVALGVLECSVFGFRRPQWQQASIRDSINKKTKAHTRMHEPEGPLLLDGHKVAAAGTSELLGLGELASSLLTQQQNVQATTTAHNVKYPTPPSSMLPPAPGTPVRSDALLQSDAVKQALADRRQEQDCDCEIEEEEDSSILNASGIQSQSNHTFGAPSYAIQPAQRRPAARDDACEPQLTDTPSERMEWPRSRSVHSLQMCMQIPPPQSAVFMSALTVFCPPLSLHS
jgi:hypothetical protein